MVNVKDWSHLGIPIQLPAGEKFPPPRGFTGASAKKLSASQREAQIELVQKHVDKGGNWGIVPGKKYVVIDVDAHKTRSIATIADRTVREYGMQKREPLQISSRFSENTTSGHYWYKLPKNHDRKKYALRSSLSADGHVWADVCHRHLRYLVMPGSVVEGREYLHRNDPSDIPEIPGRLYQELLQPLPKKLVMRDDGLYTDEELVGAKAQMKWNLFNFKLARPGTRDNMHMITCRSIGTYLRVKPDGDLDEATLAHYQKVVGSICKNLYAEEKSEGKEVAAKTRSHIEYGFNNPKLLYTRNTQDADNWWWMSRPTLERTYNRAMLASVSPMALLTAQLTMLASATDHRVRLRVERGEWALTPAPISLWLAVVGPPGSGKSLLENMVADWIADKVPEVEDPPYPTKALSFDPELDITEVADEDLYMARLKASAPEVMRYAPSTMNGVFPMFYSRMKIGKVWKEVKVLFRGLIYYDEPEVLFNKNARDYNLQSMLRSTFFSRGYSHSVGKMESRYFLEENSYSLSMIINAQPSMMVKFREAHESGTYQRFIFVEAGLDPNVSRELKNIGEKLPTQLPKVKKWTPQKRRTLDDGSTRRKSLVEMDKRGAQEVEDLEFWAMGGDIRDFDISDENEESWMAMCPQGKPAEAMQHLTIKLQRLAILLYRHDGGKLKKKGVTKIPYVYFADAKQIMAHSAYMVLRSIQMDHDRYAAKEKYRRAVLSDDTKVVEEAKYQVKMGRVPASLEEWLEQQFEGGALENTLLWGPLNNRAASTNWGCGMTAAQRRDAIASVPGYKILTKPYRVQKVAGVSDGATGK